MKTFNNFYHTILLIPFLILLGTSCSSSSACIKQWAECYNNCPPQEEADAEVADCLEGCRTQHPNDIEAWSRCSMACYNRSREACVDACGDQLQRCLEEENN